MSKTASAGWITTTPTTASLPGCGPTSRGQPAGGGLQLHAGATACLPARGTGTVTTGWCSTPTASITGAATMMWVWSSSPSRPLAGDGAQHSAGSAAARDLVHQTGVLMFAMEKGRTIRWGPARRDGLSLLRLGAAIGQGGALPVRRAGAGAGAPRAARRAASTASAMCAASRPVSATVTGCTARRRRDAVRPGQAADRPLRQGAQPPDPLG